MISLPASAAGMEHLKVLKSLRELYMKKDTTVSDAAAEKFQRQMPQMKYVW